MTGTIKKIVLGKGFGFITAEGLNHDLFFHSNALNGVSFAELREGDHVNYIAEEISQHVLATSPPPVALRKLQECNAELVAYLSKRPDALSDLHPGTFENIVAEIFRHEGFTTERITGWNQADGGVDLIAVRQLSPGYDLRVAVQCKIIRGRRLSAEPIRALLGVLDRFRAHAGVVATTGLFTEQAIEETNIDLWHISLRDYNDILASLNRLNQTSVRPRFVAYSVTRC